MANKMIIDASHPEETRVVVLRGSRVEEFDFESASKKPLRGNIYLAKVTRVEPSLQAAFVDYGGNRHGFLAFSEIHPDYYQIPVADRQALLEEEARSQREEDEEPNGERRSRRHRRPRPHEAEARAQSGDSVSEAAAADLGDDFAPATPASDYSSGEAESVAPTESADAAGEPVRSDEAKAAADSPPAEFPSTEVNAADADAPDEARLAEGAPEPFVAREPELDFGALEAEPADTHDTQRHAEPPAAGEAGGEDHHEDDDHEVTTLEGGSEERSRRPRRNNGEDEGEPVEQVGGDALEEVPRRTPRLRRQYKIQEVIKRRQVLLVQVVKEERGNKGAALTTYLSLAGRYSVLMPNTARGGGISRKITNAQDRSRLKSIAEELDVPEGMGVILRTAGASRTKAEVKRDFEYLLRMWETVRETTLASSAPTLVYEEGSLIKRAIRDLYSKDVEEIVVAGEAGYREAKEFMRLLMPSHAQCVQPYRDVQPVFAKAGVEAQLDAMFSNQVTLKSGGYIVINQTEALVAIDVNSGRSTREHNIEDTALRTNLEAADEVARQLRLRDLAGLIVVDFIDMEESRNNRAVERRMKDALKNDRARIQVGRISHFGLLEMSRQRIRTGVLEGSTVVCPHCMGAGVVRSTASVALHVLRVLEDALIKSSSHDMIVRTRTAVALYILNQKRANLRDLERRFGVAIAIEADDTLTGSNYHTLERGELATGVKIVEEPKPYAESDEVPYAEIEEEPAADEAAGPGEGEGEDEMSEDEAGLAERPSGAQEDGENGRRRRRRRRRRGSERGPGENVAADAPQPTDDGLAVVAEIGGDLPYAGLEAEGGEGAGRRAPDDRGRRSRRSRGRGRDRFGNRGPLEPTAPAFGETAEAGGEFVAAAATDAEAPAEFATPAQPSAPEAAPAVRAEAPAAPPAPVASVEAAPASEAPAPSRAAPNVPAAEAPPAAPAVDDPSRPRRAGWWQRARATIVGE